MKAVRILRDNAAAGMLEGRVVCHDVRDAQGTIAVEKGQVLDNFYIPSRYPNSHPEGAPFEHYGPLQSHEAIQHAGEILAFVRAQMA